MKLPYNQVHANGDIIFAARSGRIQTYKLMSQKFIAAAWQHPDVEKVANVIENNKVVENNEKSGEQTLIIEPSTEANTPQDDTDGPPAKRQKTAAEDDVSTSKPQEAPQDGGDKKPERKRAGRGKISRVPDRPIITHLTSTADGKHVLAVTGHDKTIWIFEHDGEGHLTLISQRAMAKRPCAIEISSDGKIICGDKFGDVYALPLIQDPSWVPPKVAAKARTKPAANALTVHSKRNLEALRDQQFQIDKDLKAKKGEDDGPDFDCQLLLGHVSMLTALTLGEQEGSKFIITGDRDEHIRVSRYMPQTHIIEAYCFGHEHFIGALLTPPSRPDVLISGGGDNELFVWNWLSGELIFTTSVLKLAQEINPDLTKLAVTGVYSLAYEADFGELRQTGEGKQTFILAICEQVKAIFTWQLTDDNKLNHPGVIQLPGEPLSLTVAPRPHNQPTGRYPKVIAALDHGSEENAAAMFAFTVELDDNRLSTHIFSYMGADDAESAQDLEIEEKEIHNLLYNIEHLRKQKTFNVAAEEEEEEEEGLEEELVTPETEEQ